MAEMDSGLLDLPLGVKVPVKPRSKPFSRGKLGEKLQQPSPFNLDDPYIHNTTLHYNCLHDPHLRDYHKHKDILQMLKRQGVVTSDNKKSKETPLKSGKLRRGKIALDKGQMYSSAELGQEDATTAADSRRKQDNTADSLFKAVFEQLSAAEVQKLQEMVEAIVYKVFARLKVPRDLHVTFLRNTAQGIRGSAFSSCMRTEPADTPLDHHQEIEVVAKELLAMVLESLGDHLEFKAFKPGRAARWKKQSADRGASQAEIPKEAETASLHRACIQAALDNLTIQVVKNVHCLLKSMITSLFEGDSSCDCTEFLKLPRRKVSNRRMQPGFPGASKQQSQEASMRLKLPPLGPQLHGEGTGYAKTMKPKYPAMVKESLVRDANPTTSDTSDTRTMESEDYSVCIRADL